MAVICIAMCADRFGVVRKHAAVIANDQKVAKVWPPQFLHTMSSS